MFVPADYQPDLDLDRLIVKPQEGEEEIPVDILFVGAGPAGLAGAIRLAQRLQKEGGELGEIEIGVLEKAESLGEHNLSGAVVNPRAFRELFPDMKDDDFPFRQPVKGEKVYYLRENGAIPVPTPPEMKNHGNYAASICEMVRWLGEQAEGMGVNLFTGYPADSLLVGEQNEVIGVRTTPSGLDRDGNPGPEAMPAGNVTAKVTVLCDGTRSMLSQAYQRWQEIEGDNPQIYALGVKELWEVDKPLDTIIHTLGWPLTFESFGGSWIYPMGENMVSLGLVVGLDYRDHTLDVHTLTQQLKQHPLVRDILKGGKLVEWGAKTIPEGGLYSLPQRMHGDGILMCGDAVGTVNVAALKGIHYAMQSGMMAADAIFDALKAGDFSAETLKSYDEAFEGSYIHQDLHRTRNMRLAFKDGLYVGGMKAGVAMATKGAFPTWQIKTEEDAEEPRWEVTPPTDLKPDGELTYSKVDAVYHSGNATRDDIPPHLETIEGLEPEVMDFYHHMCPAGVYERQSDKLVINAPNCVDCKATDVVGPRWSPREGGSGPKYKQM